MPVQTPEQKAREQIDAMVSGTSRRATPSHRAGFNQWLRTKDAAAFGPSTINSQLSEPGAVDQPAWLGLIKDQIATSLSIEPDDFDYAPFSQRSGLSKAHQLFGEQLPKLLDELNEALAA